MADWKLHQKELEELYMKKNQSLPVVRGYMLEIYNFSAS